MITEKLFFLEGLWYLKVNWSRKILKKISSLLNIDIDKVCLKATSTEDQGFINSKNGIAAQAIVSIEVPEYEK